MNNTVFIDTNVLLDVLLARKPFVVDAQRIWTHAERGAIKAVASAASFMNVFYIVRRLTSRLDAERAVKEMLAIFTVAAVDREVIDHAIGMGVADFEDAVQAACAARVGASCIITRDERHFRSSVVPAIAPDAFLADITAE